MAKFIIFLFVLSGVVFFFLSNQSNSDEISAEQLRIELLDPSTIQLIDVREPVEHSEYAIESSVLIPLSTIESQLGQISKDKNVVVYCRSGRRSQQAIAILKANGLNNVKHLKGGVLSWMKSDF